MRQAGACVAAVAVFLIINIIFISVFFAVHDTFLLNDGKRGRGGCGHACLFL